MISATFMFPGLQGHLRAYDVTGIAMQASVNSTIQTITSPDPGSPSGRSVATGGSILWDAAAPPQRPDPRQPDDLRRL